ncbi:hypothetical protein CYMTET_49277 [Cymbomonas tetramitiformis]|uniref:Uncharacterized protein n=1 Tax=Cymbomonas tetramitiformis TaxID=36881 RepID=A0AAE0BSH1_9CHLO|nr:hypothetical protein CYMTET_49277 [Cymbomonas tetramitiformis]
MEPEHENAGKEQAVPSDAADSRLAESCPEAAVHAGSSDSGPPLHYDIQASFSKKAYYYWGQVMPQNLTGGDPAAKSLWKAAASGDIATCESIAHKVESPRALIEKHNPYGLTAVHLAAANGHTHILRHFQKVAGSEALEVVTADGLAGTPLHWASAAGHIPAAMALLDACPTAVDRVDECKLSALSLAAMQAKVLMVCCLVRRGANVNSQDQNGCTALGWVLLRHRYSRRCCASGTCAGCSITLDARVVTTA